MLTLKNKQVSLTIAPEHGSNLVSWKYKNKELIYTDQEILQRHGFTVFFVLWPFPNRVRNKQYVFKAKTYSLENLDKAELGFGFGLHPLFKNAQAIKIPARHVMESDKDLLPTGKLLPANLNHITQVADLDLDDVFTNLTGPQTVAFANGLNLTISASPDFTHAVVYTGEKDKYTAVEQQTCSTNAHNLDALGFKKESHLIRIKPGKHHKGWVRYSVIE